MNQLEKNKHALFEEEFEVRYFQEFHKPPTREELQAYIFSLLNETEQEEFYVQAHYEEDLVDSAHWITYLEEKTLRSLHWAHQHTGDLL